MKTSVLFLLLFIIIFLLTMFNFSFGKSSAELKAQEVFPGKAVMYSADDKVRSNIAKINGKHKVVFYLKSSDEYCLMELNSIYRIIKLYDSPDISYILLWEDSVPSDQVIKAGLDINKNYSLRNKRSLSKYFPSAFILDEKNRVERIEKTEYITLANELYELNGNIDLTEKVNRMLLDEAFSKEILADSAQDNSLKYDPDKNTLIMFLNSGCKFCIEGENVLKNNVSLLLDRFNIIIVRSASEERQISDVNLVHDYSLIYFNTYSQTFKAGKQPLYVILDGGGQIIDVIKETSVFIRYMDS